MIGEKKIIVVLPAYNAAATLEKTFREIPWDITDEVILVDDFSADHTLEVAKALGIETVIAHDQNKGYGGNQKTCYNKALESGADIVIMLHPDYQYTPRLIHSMAYLIANNVYPVVLGSRILGRGALKGGMPWWRYLFNRVLTLIQNILMSEKLSEYHTGFRAFSAEVLQSVPYQRNSNNFVFDNQILAQILYKGYEVAEITCPTSYHKEASSINFISSIQYGWGVLMTAWAYRMQKWGITSFNFLEK